MFGDTFQRRSKIDMRMSTAYGRANQFATFWIAMTLKTCAEVSTQAESDAAAYLTVIDRDPEAVQDALAVPVE
jgi:hypothetical protein